MRGLSNPIRQLLAWQARVLLREEEWVFDAMFDLADMIDAIDARLQRKPAPKGLVIWATPSRAISVCVTVSNRIEVFTGGWTLRPHLFGRMYFAGVLTESAVRGRFRQPAYPRAFLLLAVNMIFIWLLIALSLVVYMTGGCLLAGSDYCDYTRNSLGVFVGGSVFAAVVYIFSRLYAWVSGLGRQKIHAFLIDLTMSDNDNPI